MFGMFDAIYAYLSRMVGNRTDAASSTGSLHAKAKDTSDKIGSSADTRASNTLFGVAGTQVKSIQRGTSTMTTGSTNVTATISSVNLSKSILLMTNDVAVDINNTNGLNSAMVRGRLNSSTQLSFDRTSNAAATGTLSIDWQVIEFY